MARHHTPVVVLLTVILLVTGTWTAVAHHDAELGDQRAAARERDARAVTSLALPAGFTPIACEGATAIFDRCWRVAVLPDEALDDAVRALGAGGRDAPPACTRSAEDLVMGCNATVGTVTLVATRDLNEAWTSKDDVLAGTSTLAMTQTGPA
ncbi:hypothetical protein [Cellulomonas rhizosphaerae]|uniref:Uncharacterized protein n=1 Tax=Cellulomonas rhizosphaerae TaxID=2293719 RepID=A0A413RPF8_9CELL|nr:hypothetical protein [Cellulomonas rhizosphaerae]RHA43902.1 hypothetical protein D1825_03985 [Cellulomonas rhizosphaerae]